MRCNKRNESSAKKKFSSLMQCCSNRWRDRVPTIQRQEADRRKMMGLVRARVLVPACAIRWRYHSTSTTTVRSSGTSTRTRIHKSRVLLKGFHYQASTSTYSYGIVVKSSYDVVTVLFAGFVFVVPFVRSGTRTRRLRTVHAALVLLRAIAWVANLLTLF